MADSSVVPSRAEGRGPFGPGSQGASVRALRLLPLRPCVPLLALPARRALPRAFPAAGRWLSPTGGRRMTKHRAEASRRDSPRQQWLGGLPDPRRHIFIPASPGGFHFSLEHGWRNNPPLYKEKKRRKQPHVYVTSPPGQGHVHGRPRCTSG